MSTKKKCSCYGGFDCQICNPEYYKKQLIEHDKQSTANEWADAIAKSLSNNLDDIPEGFYTTKQIAKMRKRGISNTKEMISNLLNEGLAEKKIFKTQCTTRQSPIPYYRIIK